MSPTIFNVVFDAFIQHWVTVVGGPQEGAGREVLGTSIQDILALFCAHDRLVASPKSARLQGAVDAFVGLFDRVVFWGNEGKTVSISCWSFHTPHLWSTEAYNWRVAGR